MFHFAQKSPSLLAAAVVTAGLHASPVLDTAHAQLPTQIVVVSGDPAPDGNGFFDNNPDFDYPVLNDLGQAAFRAFLFDTAGGTSDDTGIFRGDGLSPLIQISRATNPTPNAVGTFNNYNPTYINDAGQTAFYGYVTGSVVDDRGIFRGDGPGTVTQIARWGHAVPGGNGTFAFPNGISPTINEAGLVGFVTSLNATSGGASDNTGIYLGNGGALTEIAREGQPVPGGNGLFGNLGSTPILNDNGQAAFFAGSFTGTSGGFDDNAAIYRYDGGGVLTQIVRKGQSAPDSNGTFSNISGSSLNNAGNVAFNGSLTGTSGGSTDDSGIFVGDGSSLTQIARAGQAAPDANGTFDFFGQSSLNNAGQIAFLGFLTGTSEQTGIYRSDSGVLNQIAREGQAAPDGNGVFSIFNFNPALNDAGQTAFLAELSGTLGGTNDDKGLFMFDDNLGLVQIARKGDDLLGSTITDLFFNASTGFGGDESSGLNELGQVAYRFALADGRTGIAITTIPEPATLAMLAAGGLMMLRFRGRRRD